MTATRLHTLTVFPATLRDLRDIRRFVTDTLTAEGMEDQVHALVLAIDEVCANLIEHGYADSAAGSIELAIATNDWGARLTIEDNGITFGPDDAPAPDLDSDAESRRIGGLGWHFVRELVDRYQHEPRAGGGNRLHLFKRRTAPLSSSEQLP